MPDDLHRDPRCPHAQPQGHRHRRSEAPARRLYRRERQRQVVARVRHDLHGGAAPPRRYVQHLRSPPAAPAHPATGRCDPEHLPLHRDRPEAPRSQQPQHRRHRHRDLHLPADALLALRPAVRRLVAPLLVQSSRWHVPGLQGTRQAHHGRRRQAARPRPEHRGGRHPPSSLRHRQVVLARDRPDWGRPAPQAAAPVHRGRAGAPAVVGRRADREGPPGRHVRGPSKASPASSIGCTSTRTRTRSGARARRRIGGCSRSGRAPIAAALGSTPRRARWSWRATGPSAGSSSAS